MTEIKSYNNLLEQFLQSRRRLVGYLLVFLMLPFLTSFGLATEVLIFGLFALAFNLLWGFSGLLSFGHALFLGAGAYTAALLVIHIGAPLIVVFGAVVAMGILIGLFVGALSLRLTGIYFAIITLAFAQFFYELSFTFSGITGGSDGLIGIYRPSFFGLDMIQIGDSIVFYGFVLIIVLSVLTFMHLISQSTFGRTLRAIRENEERTEALGVNTYRVKLVTFVISSIIAGIAGALWALHIRFLSPGILFWTFSGDAVLYTLIGGMHSLFGPIAGALGLIWVEHSLFHSRPGLLNLFIGGLFIFVVLFVRSGIVGVVEQGAFRIANHLDEDHQTDSSEPTSDVKED